MNYYTSDTIRTFEKQIIEKYSVPEALLMENAGGAAAAIILRRFSANNILILAGPGKNGGDGYVTARHLVSGGKAAEVISAVPAEKLHGTTEYNMKLALRCGIAVTCSSAFSDAHLTGKILEADLVVDALLGIGFEGPLRGEIARLCALCNETRSIVALDIPTGIDPDSGTADNNCVRAATTIAMIAPKTGISTGKGRIHAGEVIVAPVGFPLPEASLPRIRSFSEKDGKRLLPVFPEDIHKGMRGGVMVIGGNTVYRGAPMLSVRSFLRAGGGLAILFSDENSCAPCSAFLPEAIFESNLFSKTDHEITETIRAWESRIDSILLGPGIGRSERAGEICHLVLSVWKGRIIIDGDGLFWLAKMKEKHARNNLLLTPHEGEAARLLGIAPEDVRNSRISSVRTIAEQWGTVVLKGADTLCDDGQETFIVTAGNRSLAVPGSGDVLAGIIAAFLSNGSPLLESAALGAFIHGKAGYSLALSTGSDGILASEISDEVPVILKRMRNQVP